MHYEEEIIMEVMAIVLLIFFVVIFVYQLFSQEKGTNQKIIHKHMENTKNIAKKQADEQFCPSCGEVIKIEAVICPKCGVSMKKKKGSSDKSKITAALLALFLGGFGIHRFYLGQAGVGFIYLLFFWTFIPACIAFIDFIIFLAMDEDKFDAKYNQ